MTGVPRSPASATSHEAFNPYEAPTTSVSPAITFRISSLLLVIAALAVCLGVWHEAPVLGIILAVVVAPALLYTSIVASGSAAEGKPMAVFQKVWSFLAAIGGVVVIAISGFIAFGITCFSVGFGVLNIKMTGSEYILVGISGTVALAAASMTYRLLTRKRRSVRPAARP